jgi:hypothetical protein
VAERGRSGSKVAEITDPAVAGSILSTQPAPSSRYFGPPLCKSLCLVLVNPGNGYWRVRQSLLHDHRMESTTCPLEGPDLGSGSSIINCDLQPKRQNGVVPFLDCELGTLRRKTPPEVETESIDAKRSVHCPIHWYCAVHVRTSRVVYHFS